jgi:hypothetical protein
VTLCVAVTGQFRLAACGAMPAPVAGANRVLPVPCILFYRKFVRVRNM